MDNNTARSEAALPEERHVFLVEKNEARMRLDRFLAEKLRAAGLSREKVKELIRAGLVAVDGIAQSAARRALAYGSEVRVIVPAHSSGLTPEEGTLSLVYRDAELAVLDKPAGIVVHPAPGLTTGTLAHRLVAHFPELAAQEGFRPGIVHRLDKETSGLMLVALTEKCRLALAAMFAAHTVYKEYLTLVHGVPQSPQGVIDAPVGRHPEHKTKMAVSAWGKAAKSSWRVLHADPRGVFSLLAVRIYSGRTHQVRVHMQHIGCPVYADALYRGKEGAAQRTGRQHPDRSEKPDAPAGARPPARQMLHAWKLGFAHPFPEALRLTEDSDAGRPWSISIEDGKLLLCCPPPQDFIAAARFLSRSCLRVVVTGLPGCGKSALLEAWRRLGIAVFSADDAVRRLYEKGGDGQRLLFARFGERFVYGPDAPVDKAALGAAMKDEPSLRREVEALIHPLVRHALHSFWQEQEELGAELAAAEIPLYLEADFAGTRGAGGMRTGTGAGGTRAGAGAGGTRAGAGAGGTWTGTGAGGTRTGTGAGGTRTGAGADTGDCAAAGGAGAGFAGGRDEAAEQPEAAQVLVGVRCPSAVRRQRLMQKRGWSEETIAFMESWQWPEEKKMAACDMLLDNAGTEEEFVERAGELAVRLFALRRVQEERLTAWLEGLRGGQRGAER
jgi:23S rRNA pseudouridine1911/1915/1917 synthase